MGDSVCNVFPLPHADGESHSEEMFALEIEVSTMQFPEHEADEEEEDEDGQSWILDAECDVQKETFLLERRHLVDAADEVAGATVEGVLDAMKVPRSEQAFMVASILECARKIARDEGYLGDKVLLHRIGVSIHLPPGLSFNEDEDDDDEEEEEEESGLTFEEDD